MTGMAGLSYIIHLNTTTGAFDFPWVSLIDTPIDPEAWEAHFLAETDFAEKLYSGSTLGGTVLDSTIESLEITSIANWHVTSGEGASHELS